MSRHARDDWDVLEDLTPERRAQVQRYVDRWARHAATPRPLTIRERLDDFDIAEAQDEADRDRNNR